MIGVTVIYMYSLFATVVAWANCKQQPRQNFVVDISPADFAPPAFDLGVAVDNSTIHLRAQTGFAERVFSRGCALPRSHCCGRAQNFGFKQEYQELLLITLRILPTAVIFTGTIGTSTNSIYQILQQILFDLLQIRNI